MKTTVTVKYQLTNHIIALSESKCWGVLDDIYFADYQETCSCGHYPIIEVCVIKNKLNNNTTIVGNCCVKKFMGLPSDKIFQSVKRVRKEMHKSLNPAAIEYAYKKGWINPWEYKFYIDTMRKRYHQLSEKQLSIRKNINNKMLLNMRKDTEKVRVHNYG